MIPEFISDKIGKSPAAIPVGAAITAYGGYKVIKKQYAVGVTWIITGVGIIQAGIEEKQEKNKDKQDTKKK